MKIWKLCGTDETPVWFLVKVARCVIYIYDKTNWRGPFKAIIDWGVMGVTDDVHMISRTDVDEKVKIDDSYHLK